MYFIYCEKPIEQKFKINIPRFGLTFSSLNNHQSKYIKEQYDEIYSERFKIYKALIYSDDGVIKFDRNKKKSLEENSKLIDIIQMIYYNRIKPIFHKDVEKLLKHIIVVDVDNNRLNKYIAEEDFRLFIAQFVNLHKLFDQKGTKKQHKQRKYIPYINRKYREKTFPDLRDLTREIIQKYMLNICEQESYGCLSVGKSFIQYLMSIGKFINTISNEDVFKFIEIMELFFSNSRLAQNNILNDILIIESLLINRESDSISKEFILKTGIVYKYSKDSKKKRNYSNKDLRVILKYLYEMRSIIIHGNTEKIFDNYNKLTMKNNSLNYPKIGKVSKMQKKIIILKFTEELSYEFVKMVFLYWINNTNKIDFIRNN